MKLHNYTVLYLSGAMFVVLSIWAAIFYINMLDEIHDSIDDGLNNSKILIINKVSEDSSLLYKDNFLESNYRIREVRKEDYLDFKDTFTDTLLYTEYEADYEPFRMLTTVFAAPNGKFYKLRVISSMVEEDDLIEDLLYSLLWLYIILIVSMVAINYLLLGRIWRSFYSTLKAVRGYKISDKQDIRFEKTRVSEFKRLQETLQDLIRSNKEVFLAQKQFIENASHELQTPLAISINKLELLAEKHPLNDDQLQQIGAVIENLERLTRLNKSLLLLSKIDNRQFEQSEAADMNAVIYKLAEDFEELAEYRRLQLHIEEDGRCVYTMNRTLAEVLFTNLIKNALAHTESGGLVKIHIRNTQVCIENSGGPALDTTRIFQRFYKESGDAGSTGLGLAIVKSIAAVYGFSLNYSYNGLHRFCVHF